MSGYYKSPCGNGSKIASWSHRNCASQRVANGRSEAGREPAMNHKVLRALLVLALASVPLLASVSPAWAGAPPNRLDYNGGRVLGNPAIHNLYFDFSWDSNNPAAISRGNIDGFTGSLVSSNYFAKAGQYGVGSASFTVVPADCAIAGAANPLDGMSTTATHELIEAATDPIIVTGWIDNSKAGFNADILMSGEAADICSSAGDV